eukprot:NODE_490_length_7774_cov_0.196352.p5 type:complete len:120 gc:universal NODE_490_length_7774_cov_0.196352:623-264(-)
MGNNQEKSSIKQYLGIYRRLKNADVDINNPDDVRVFIDRRKGTTGDTLKETTRRNYYIGLLPLHGKEIKDKPFVLTETAKSAYLRTIEGLNDKRVEHDDKQEMTDVMKENWLTWNLGVF